MGEHTEINWCEHTYNAWWGCTRVSPGCDGCYAATLGHRFGVEWGADTPRRFFGAKHWNEPLRWNRRASEAGVAARVFCGSMCDVFEARTDLDEHRERLWRLIDDTPALVWLLLTKRPENIADTVPWGNNWPTNVWIGTTVENQASATHRIPHLAALPAAVRFLSCEPLVGPVTLAGHLDDINWVIAGGESGADARPMHPDWARRLRDETRDAGVPFLFKQWGEWVPRRNPDGGPAHPAVTDRTPGGYVLHDPRGNRRFGVNTTPTSPRAPWLMDRVGKHAAGRELDGVTWDDHPPLPHVPQA